MLKNSEDSMRVAHVLVEAAIPDVSCTSYVNNVENKHVGMLLFIIKMVLIIAAAYKNGKVVEDILSGFCYAVGA